MNDNFFEFKADRFDSTYELWHHIDCLFEDPTRIPTCLDAMEGIQRLRYVDQLLIIKKIKDMAPDEEIPTKRFKANNFDEVDSVNVTLIIAQQNEEYYRIYDAMNAKNPFVPERQKKKMLQEILDLNQQIKPYYKESTQVVSEPLTVTVFPSHKTI